MHASARRHLRALVGAGVFVGVGLATDVAGSGALFALLVAAALVWLDGSSAAAVSEPSFTAVSLDLIGGTGLVATAALAVAGSLEFQLGAHEMVRLPLGLLVLAVVTVWLRSGGPRVEGVRTAAAGAALALLVLLVGLAGLRAPPGALVGVLPGGGEHGWPGFLEACALGFAAFPQARRKEGGAAWAAGPALVLLLGVGFAGISVLGAGGYGHASRVGGAPLVAVASALGGPALALGLVAAATVGLSGAMVDLLDRQARELRALARRRELPEPWAAIDPDTGAPGRALLVAGGAVALILLLADPPMTWGLAALAWLGRSALTHFSVLRGGPGPLVAGAALVGLGASLLLAASVDAAVLGVAGAGLLGAHGLRALARDRAST